MSDDLIRLQIEADNTGATGAFREVSASADQLSSNLKIVGESGTEAGAAIAEGMQKADFSMREAKGSAMLLGEEIGVKMNRHVAGFIATLPGVGEAMSSAFSVLAVVAFAEILDRVIEKSTEWISNTFIFTEAMKAENAQIAAYNKAMVAAEAFTSKAQESLARFGLSASQTANRDLSQLNEKLQENEAEMIRYKAQLDDALAHPEREQNVNQLSEQLRVAKEVHEGLLAEQRLYQDKVQKADAEADAKAEKALEASWKERNRIDDENREYALKRSADFLKEFEKGEKDLEKLEEEHGNLMQTFNENTGGSGYTRFAADATDATNQLDQAEQRLIAHAKLVMEGLAKPESPLEAQKQIQAAMQQSETVLMRMMPTVNDLSKGWAAYAKSAMSSLEQASLSMMEHLAVALMVSDTIRLQKAKEAAASAYAQGEQIPFVGPIMGPILAATAYAGAMAFKQGGVVPSAAGGMLTDPSGDPDGVISLLHPNEMVLPAPLSQTVQDMAASASGTKGSGSGDVHIHAMDSKSFEQFLKSNPTALSRGVEHATDKGHLNVGKLARGK